MNSNLGQAAAVCAEESVDVLVRALQQALHDASGQDIFALGARLHRSGHVEAALRAFERVTVCDPENVAAWHALAAASLALKLSRKALDACNRALALDSQNPDTLFNTGTVLRAMGDLPAALHCYEKALELEPTHYGALRNRPLILAQMGRSEEAREGLQSALRLYAEDAWLFFNVGELSMAFGETAAAVDAYEKALSIDPSLHLAGQALAAALEIINANAGTA